MRFRFSVLIFSVVFSLNLRAQFSWYEQTSGVITTIKDVLFYDDFTGWAVGQGSVVLHTTDGGTNWISQTLSGTDDLYEIAIRNNDLAYIVGGTGNIYKTDDGGVNWINVAYVPLSIAEGIFFVNDTLGWVCGYDGTNGQVYKTIDGGFSWINQPVSASVSGFWDVQFVTDQIGWIVGWGGIYRTNDGGNTWIPQTNPTGNLLEAIYMVDIQIGYIVGFNGTILKTTNGGDTWILQSSGLTTTLLDVEFVDQNVGVAAGENGGLVYTVNGGVNWFVALDFTSTLQLFSTIDLRSYTSAYIAGGGGKIFKAPANSNDLEVLSYQGLDTICSGVPVNVVLSIQNNGPAAIEDADFVITDGTTIVLTYHWSGLLNSGDTELINLGQASSLVSTTFYCSIDGDTVTSNNVSSKYIEVVPNPAEVSSDQIICEGDSVLIQASGGNQYQWMNATVDSLNPVQIVKPQISTYFYVQIKTDYCFPFDSVYVTVNPCTEDITAFSPNGDGVNDHFIIDDLNGAENSLKIYNRWGDLVSSYTNYDNVTVFWDGTDFNGVNLLEGTYFYVFETSDLSITKSNWVQIVR